MKICRVFRRNLQMFPENSEQYIEYLTSVDKLDEASQVFDTLQCCNKDFGGVLCKAFIIGWEPVCVHYTKPGTCIN